MNTKRMLLVIAVIALAIAGLARTARATDFRPAVIERPTGTLDVEQDIPCDNHISRIVAVSGGGIALSPALGTDLSVNKIFSLIRLHVTFDGFGASGDCGAVRASVSYSEIGVQLERAVSFTAVPATGRGYTFTIPRELFLVQVIDRRDGELERSLRRPSEDVTGAIDLDTGRFSIHVVTAQTMHFQGGCFVVCAIDEHDRGTITANVSGTLAFPDTDADGVPDHLDNCPFSTNADQSPVSTPTIDAPPNVTLFSCLDHTIGGATGTDVCGGGPVTISNNAPARFPLGSTTVTWTATDSKNRTAADTQIVTVIDKVPPAIACTLERSRSTVANDAWLSALLVSVPST